MITSILVCGTAFHANFSTIEFESQKVPDQNKIYTEFTDDEDFTSKRDAYLGIKGVDGCPDGTEPIYDHTECRNQAKYLGFSYYEKYTATSDNMTICNYCSGCDKFNTPTKIEDGGSTVRVDRSHASRAYWVCKSTSAKPTAQPTAQPTSAPTSGPTISSCPAGQGFTAGTTSAGTTTDAKCTACVDNTWNGVVNDQPCVEHSTTSCPAGQGFTAGTASADAKCTACVDNTWNGGSNDKPCAAHSTTSSCPAGQGFTAGTALADAECTACVAGRSGTMSQSNNDQPCVAHSTDSCPAGQGFTAGTASADAKCTACASGTMSKYKNAEPCVAARTTCAAKTGMLTAATASADVRCITCKYGTWAAAGGVLPCAEYSRTTCPAGQGFTKGWYDADAKCTKCQPPFKNDDNDDKACVSNDCKDDDHSPNKYVGILVGEHALMSCHRLKHWCTVAGLKRAGIPEGTTYAQNLAQFIKRCPVTCKKCVPCKHNIQCPASGKGSKNDFSHIVDCQLPPLKSSANQVYIENIAFGTQKTADACARVVGNNNYCDKYFQYGGVSGGGNGDGVSGTFCSCARKGRGLTKRNEDGYQTYELVGIGVSRNGGPCESKV